MHKRQNKIVKLFAIFSLLFAISYLVLVFFTPSMVLAREYPGESLGEGSVTDQGFVPCGNIKNAQGVIQNPCEPCHIFILGQNILDFLWWRISIPIATLALIYAGFLMIVPSASSTRLEKGKKVLSNALVGIAVVFFAWLAIDTIIKVLANQNLTSGVPANIQGYGPWNKIDCPIRGLPAPADRGGRTTTTQTQPPSEEFSTTPPLQTLATAILQENRITFSRAADCGGNNNAKGTMDALAAGQRPSVCSPICQCRSGGAGGNITVSETLLRAIDGASRSPAGLQFEVTSITTGRHSPASRHYQGGAVDLKPKSGSNTTYVQLEQTMRDRQALFVQCEDANGVRVNCTSSTARHVHAEFR